jgi:hypothetical protein
MGESRALARLFFVRPRMSRGFFAMVDMANMEAYTVITKFSYYSCLSDRPRKIRK